MQGRPSKKYSSTSFGRVTVIARLLGKSLCRFPGEQFLYCHLARKSVFRSKNELPAPDVLPLGHSVAGSSALTPLAFHLTSRHVLLDTQKYLCICVGKENFRKPLPIDT